MAYEIRTSRIFEKDFSRLHSELQIKVLAALEKMRKQPFFKAKKLKNTNTGMYRIRIGDYRLRFDIVGNAIYLYCVRHRKDVYKK